LTHILLYPDIYKQLCAEIRSSPNLLENGKKSVSYSAAAQLPYLGACIREALRIHPSVSMILARTVPAPGVKICGYHIPAGVEVGINPYVIHHDATIFPEPDVFRPERWLTTDVDRLAQMNRAFFAFGAGAHTCSGKNLSMMEITKLIPSLLMRYHLKPAEGFKEGLKTDNHYMALQRGVRVIVARRGV
jgi:cytochrome P450